MRITHPKTGASSDVTEAAFANVWKSLGWVAGVNASDQDSVPEGIEDSEPALAGEDNES